MPSAEHRRALGADPRFVAALKAHDELIARRALSVWVGGEPTFTDRLSNAPEWTAMAEWLDKQRRALLGLAGFAAREPGAVVLRTAGRLYPEEERPRFSVGVYADRSGRPLWSGPPDPALVAPRAPFTDLQGLRAALDRELRARGYETMLVEADARLPMRLVFAKTPLEAWSAESRSAFARPSPIDAPADSSGARDLLAEQGLYLLCLGHAPAIEPAAPELELPACEDVKGFCELLDVVASASRDACVPAMVLSGYPPPTDSCVRFTTLTPDPGVLEINMAPSPDAASFYESVAAAYAEAERIGLSPRRLHFNGDVADSGGGGHLTLGGPSPEASPFFLEPKLLPRLIRYVIGHPSLSYFFCEHAGSSAQAPRVDEGTPEAFDELKLALDWLEHSDGVTPEALWRTLAPFLVDRFGNTHRAELNVEKLYNPYLPGRGQLGLLELRALRMAPSPERWAALAVLFRSIVARLWSDRCDDLRTDWGPELHDRFSLPFFLRDDLRDVLSDLDRHGLLLDPPIVEELLSDPHRLIAAASFGGVTLELRRALDLWPLVGDLSAQGGTSRLVDPSCQRVEILLRSSETPALPLDEWRLSIDGYRVPLHPASDSEGAASIVGVRYRAYVPSLGIHPLVPAHGPLRLVFEHPERGAYALVLHLWRPDGQAYPGLPLSDDEASARRAERLVVESLDSRDRPGLIDPPRQALSVYCFDTRWLRPRCAEPPQSGG